MRTYSRITIIYNPISTGSSKANAYSLADELSTAAVPVDITATKYAGHAEQLAYQAAKTGSRPLIISSSGDGGYNEVINGVLRAQNEGGSTPTCGLLPSGNANDHYHSTRRQPLGRQILDGSHQYIDVLRLDGRRGGRPWQRYAHSYIGIGLTPRIGAELNKVRLNWLREIGIVLRALASPRATRLVVKGRQRFYDSLIFSNIGKMSKVLSLSDTAEMTDGRFEVVAFRARGRLRLLRKLFKASTTGLRTTRRTGRFDFATIKPVRVQLDGEIFRLDGLAKVSVTLEHKKLRCIM